MKMSWCRTSLPTLHRFIVHTISPAREEVKRGREEESPPRDLSWKWARVRGSEALTVSLQCTCYLALSDRREWIERMERHCTFFEWELGRSCKWMQFVTNRAAGQLLFCRDERESAVAPCISDQNASLKSASRNLSDYFFPVSIPHWSERERAWRMKKEWRKWRSSWPEIGNFFIRERSHLRFYSRLFDNFCWC